MNFYNEFLNEFLSYKRKTKKHFFLKQFLALFCDYRLKFIIFRIFRIICSQEMITYLELLRESIKGFVLRIISFIKGKEAIFTYRSL